MKKLFSDRGRKNFVGVGGSTRCYNVGDRQSVTPLDLNKLPLNTKSNIERLNNSVVKRIKGGVVYAS